MAIQGRRIKRAPPALGPELARSTVGADPEPLGGAASEAGVSMETFAPDLTPLVEGLRSLRAAADAAALAQAVEEDDAEVLVLI